MKLTGFLAGCSRTCGRPDRMVSASIPGGGSDARAAGGRDDGAGPAAGPGRADRSSGSRSTIRSCSRAAMREEFERRGRRVQVAEVARRGKWVVITLADHRGMIVIQPRMTGGFWLVEPASTRAHPPDVPTGEARGDGLVLRHAAAGQDPLVRQPDEAAAAFARSHGPDALEIGRDDLAARLRRRPGGDQADAHGPEGARRASATSTPTRSSSRRGSTPSGPRPALDATSSTGCTGRSARS